MVEQPVDTEIGLVAKSKPNSLRRFAQEHRVLFIFLVIILLAIVCIISISMISGIRSKLLETPKTDYETTSNIKDIRANEYLSRVKNTTDPKKAATYYQMAYFTLSAQYDRNPTIEKKEDLKKLGNIIKAKFPQEAKSMNLDIPCREVSCGAVFSYSKELSEIKSLVEENKTFDPDLKQMLLINIKDVALAAEKKDTKQEFHSLSSVFTNFRVEWQRTKNTSIKALAEKTLALLKEISSDNVSKEPEFFKL